MIWWITVVTLLLVPHAEALAAKRPHLLDKYNHENHTIYFEGTVECTTCHTTNDSYNRETVDLRGCHLCHNNPKDPPFPGAPNDCTICHGPTVAPIRPQSHTKAWPKLHPVMAKRDAQQCATCHNAATCVDCHQQRDSVRQTMHRRNFRFFHSIEARANPARCDRCHTVNFCTECHQERRLP